MKKLLVLLSLLVMPFALASNKESIKPVLAEEDANATITIGENTFSRVTTSNMDKIKDGAKVMLVTENPTYGQLIVSSNRNGSYSPFSYTIENLGTNNYLFNVKSSNNKYELTMLINNIEYKLYSPLKNLDYFYLLNSDDLKIKQNTASAPVYSSEYNLTKGFYGDEINDYPTFTMDINNTIKTFQSYTNYSYSSSKQALTVFTTNTTKSKYGVSSIYVLSEASSEPTNEEKAAAFINKWKAYDADFCANLKDDTKRAELQALIDEYDALDIEVKNIIATTTIKTGVTIENQIEYVRNSLLIDNKNNASNHLINLIASNDSTISYIVILSISIITLIGYALVLKAKKD